MRLTAGHVTLRPVTDADIQMVREWRNSETVRSQLVDRSEISPEQQRTWWSKMRFDPFYFAWICESQGKPFGFVWVKLDQDLSGTTGIFMGPAGHGTGDAFFVTHAINNWFFDELRRDSLRCECFATNRSGVRYNRSIGYEDEWVNPDTLLIRMVLTRESHEKFKTRMERIIRGNPQFPLFA